MRGEHCLSVRLSDTVDPPSVRITPARGGEWSDATTQAAALG